MSVRNFGYMSDEQRAAAVAKRIATNAREKRERILIVRRYVAEGATVTRAAQKAGVSVDTARRYLRPAATRYLEEGSRQSAPIQPTMSSQLAHERANQHPWPQEH